MPPRPVPQPCPQQPPAALSKPRWAGNSCCAAVRCVLHKRIPAEGAPENDKDLYQNIGEALSLDIGLFCVRNVKCHFRFWGEKGEKGAAASPPVPHPCCQAPSERCSPSPNPHLGSVSDACGIGDSISSGNLQTWLTLAGATWSGQVPGASFPFLIAFFFPPILYAWKVFQQQYIFQEKPQRPRSVALKLSEGWVFSLLEMASVGRTKPSDEWTLRGSKLQPR